MRSNNNSFFDHVIIKKTGGYDVVSDALNYILELYQTSIKEPDKKTKREIENISKMIKIIGLLKYENYPVIIESRTTDCLMMSKLFLESIFRFWFLVDDNHNIHYHTLIRFYTLNNEQISKFICVLGVSFEN